MTEEKTVDYSQIPNEEFKTILNEMSADEILAVGDLDLILRKLLNNQQEEDDV